MMHHKGRQTAQQRGTPASLARESSFRSLLATQARRPVRRGRQVRTIVRSNSVRALEGDGPAATPLDVEAVLVPLVNITTWDQSPHGAAQAPPSAPSPPPLPAPAEPTAASRQFGRGQPLGSRVAPLPRGQSVSVSPVVEAGTFRVADAGPFPTAAEMAYDVRAINDPGVEQRERSTRQKTIDDFLQTLQARPPAGPPQASPAPASQPTPAGGVIDPLDVIADTEELVRGSQPVPPRMPAVQSWLGNSQRSAAAFSSAPPMPPAPPTVPSTRPWSDFFHFPAGTSFVVDGPMSYNGTGRVLELTPSVLKFEMHMPDYEILGNKIPRADIVISVTYTQDGSGNTATIVANGQTVQDTNLTIRTRGDRRHIVPSLSIPGVNLGEISVARDGADEIDLDLTIDGQEWDFDLERSGGAAAQSWRPARATSTPSGPLPNLSAWEHLISHRPAPDLQRSIRSRVGGVAAWSGWPIQTIEDKANGPINLDYYPVQVTRLPQLAGRTLTAEELLTTIRLSFNRLIDTRFSNFEPYDAAEAARWTSASPLGSLIHIDMRMGSAAANPDDGSVACTAFTPQSWIFSTIWTPADLFHPVSGNRQFGFEGADDGSWIFYTRGADRPAGLLDWALQGTLFSQAHALWMSLQQGIATFVNSNGGSASILPATSERYDWAAVQPLYHHPTESWI